MNEDKADRRIRSKEAPNETKRISELVATLHMRKHCPAISAARLFAQQTPANHTVPVVVSCVSKLGERMVCSADWSASVALLRSTGEASCILGKNWAAKPADLFRGVAKVGSCVGNADYMAPGWCVTLLDPDFKNRYLILAVEFFVARNAEVYSGSRIDLDSVTATGESGFGVFTISFGYDFSWRTSHEPASDNDAIKTRRCYLQPHLFFVDPAGLVTTEGRQRGRFRQQLLEPPAGTETSG